MDKYTDWLEKNVQWLALGVGGIYLLWMVWGYVIQPPVTAEIGNQTFRPGQVDRAIAEGPAARLEEAMRTTRAPQMEVRPLAQEFAARIRGEGIIVSDLMPAMAGIAAPIPEIVTVNGNRVAPVEAPKPEAPVARLPEVPMARYHGMSHGRSEIIVPVVQEQPRPGMRPGMRDRQVHTEDRDWVSLGFVVSMDELVRAFDEVNLPEGAFRTLFLQVELVRRERTPEGWSEEVVIRPLDQDWLRRFPGENPREQIEFLQWASENQLNIVQPIYHQIARGDQWYAPGEPSPLELARQEEAERERQQRMTDVERRRQQQERQRQQRQRPQRDDDFDPFMDRYGDDDDDFDDMWLYEEMTGDRGIPRRPADPRTRRDTRPRRDGGLDLRGEFNPAERDEDITIWVHDDSVEPGRTYQYRLRYRIRNPIFQMRALAADPQLANAFYLESPFSDWSDELNVPPRTHFFMAGSGVGGAVRFDIFRWESGTWYRTSAQAYPGDRIGELIGFDDDFGERVEVDFRTDSTVVDVRDRGSSVILVNDQDGMLSSRDSRTDRADETYRDLQREAQEVASSSVPGPPVAGRQPPATARPRY